MDFRGIVADAADGPLAGRVKARQRERRHRVEPRLRRDVSRMPPAPQSPPRCKAAASCRSCKAKRRPIGARAFYYHYYEHPAEHNVARHYGVVTDRYKLVHFYEPEFNYWELFDLKTDPHELSNAIDKPEYAKIRDELKTELTRLRAELKVPDPDPAETILKPPPVPKKASDFLSGPKVVCLGILPTSVIDTRRRRRLDCSSFKNSIPKSARGRRYRGRRTGDYWDRHRSDRDHADDLARIRTSRSSRCGRSFRCRQIRPCRGRRQ